MKEQNIDFNSAFDSVIREQLYATMLEKGHTNEAGKTNQSCTEKCKEQG
jgi:hypothetical protein